MNLATLDDDKLQMNPNAMSRNLCTLNKNQSKYPRMIQHQFLVVIQVNLRALGVSKTQMLRSMIRNLCAMNRDQPTHPRTTRQAAVLVTSSAGPVGMAGSAWMLRHQIRNWCPLRIQRLPHRAQHLHRTRS